MSSSLRLKSSFFIALIFWMSVVGAVELGVSPPSIDFYARAGEEICNSIELFSDLDEVEVGVEDLWSDAGVGQKNPDFFVLDFFPGVNLDYEKFFVLEERRDFDVCLRAEKKGDYQGLLVFNVLNGSLAIGCWINVYVEEGNYAGGSFLTGKSIANIANMNELKKAGPLLYFTAILLGILIFLSWKLRGHNVAR